MTTQLKWPCANRIELVSKLLELVVASKTDKVKSFDRLFSKIKIGSIGIELVSKSDAKIGIQLESHIKKEIITTKSIIQVVENLFIKYYKTGEYPHGGLSAIAVSEKYFGINSTNNFLNLKMDRDGHFTYFKQFPFLFGAASAVENGLPVDLVWHSLKNEKTKYINWHALNFQLLKTFFLCLSEGTTFWEAFTRFSLHLDYSEILQLKNLSVRLASKLNVKIPECRDLTTKEIKNLLRK